MDIELQDVCSGTYNYRLTIWDEHLIMEGQSRECVSKGRKGMEAQKKPSVREVLWKKKRARDRILDAVGKLCNEAWALFEKIAADRSASTKDAVTVREIGLRLRALGYLIEGEHYIDRIAFELQTREAYVTANEVARAYVEDMVLRYLDGILLYGKQSEWDDDARRAEYLTALEASLEEIHTALVPVAPQQADKSTADD
ncbi:hypothetical protein HMPREF9081_0092 [Centipeda periodontii DSM 2778]|uniref:Uncharacterized protein n=2 Tax=Centipeda TaxID=82202 RepID=F5RIK7_9FIRM|nr:hypothetical protein HMPREF9081_0092 [Centipeda periodontii DSM 2778]